jgi:hypothetical protein
LVLEEAGSELLGNKGAVGGHDIGSGERNIFLFTEDPGAALEAAWPAFSARELTPALKARSREAGGEAYTPFYPKGLRQFSAI